MTLPLADSGLDFSHLESDDEDDVKRPLWEKILLVLKKLVIEPADDLWRALGQARILPTAFFKATADYVFSGAGVIAHATEIHQAIKALRDVYSDYKNKKQNVQLKTRLFSAIFVLICAGTGLGLSASLMAFTIGAAVSGAALMPFLIAALMLMNFLLRLWPAVYSWYQIRKTYQRLKDKTMSQRQLDPAVMEQRFEILEQKVQKANRALAFAGVELFAGILAIVGTVLVTSILVGASFASLGIVPTIASSLIFASVIIGAISKFFELRRHKNELKPTSSQSEFDSRLDQQHDSSKDVTPTSSNRMIRSLSDHLPWRVSISDDLMRDDSKKPLIASDSQKRKNNSQRNGNDALVNPSTKSRNKNGNANAKKSCIAKRQSRTRAVSGFSYFNRLNNPIERNTIIVSQKKVCFG